MNLSTCNEQCTDTVHSGSCRAKQSRARAHAENHRAHAPKAHAHANKEAVRKETTVRTHPITQPAHAQPVDKPGMVGFSNEVCDIIKPIASPDIPSGAPQEDLTMHEQQAAKRGVNTVNTGQCKPAHELGQHELNRVSLPGEPDNDGVAVL